MGAGPAFAFEKRDPLFPVRGLGPSRASLFFDFFFFPTRSGFRFCFWRSFLPPFGAPDFSSPIDSLPALYLFFFSVVWS